MTTQDTLVLDTVTYCREYRQKFRAPAPAEKMLYEIAGERTMENVVVIPGRGCFAVITGSEITYRECLK
jgi:hypothetical protein